MDCDSFVFSIETQNTINDVNNLEDLFDFSNLSENQELFSNKNKNVVGKFKIETPENIWIDAFVCLVSKAYSFKSGNKNTSKLKGCSKSCSKKIEFDEYKKSLDGEGYRGECDSYIIRSPNNEMYFQLVQKSALSPFDDKRCYIDIIESKTLEITKFSYSINRCEIKRKNEKNYK